MPNLYAALDDFKADIDFTQSDASKDAAMLRWLEGASRTIDGYTHRKFLPFHGTLQGYVSEAADRVMLEEDLVSLTSWSADGDDITTPYDLLPLGNSLRGLPYDAVRLNDGSRFYPATMPVVIAITGVFGWAEDARPATAVAVEQSAAATTLLVPTGTVPIGATLKIGAEYEYVLSRTTGAPNDTLTVSRAVNGTTAAIHAAGAVVYRLRPPVDIEIATIAHAARIWKRRSSSWANVAVNSALGTMELFKGLDADVKLMLEPYLKYST